MALKEEGNVKVDVGGKSFQGHWAVDGDTITVSYLDERRSAHLSSPESPPTEIAKTMLSELVGSHLFGEGPST